MSIKVLVNEDTLMLMMFLAGHKMNVAFPCCANWETFVADKKCFWFCSETFFVSRTQNLCPQQMLRARANGETFVSATMCPQQCVLVCQGLNLSCQRTKWNNKLSMDLQPLFRETQDLILTLRGSAFSNTSLIFLLRSSFVRVWSSMSVLACSKSCCAVWVWREKTNKLVERYIANNNIRIAVWVSSTIRNGDGQMKNTVKTTN